MLNLLIKISKLSLIFIILALFLLFSQGSISQAQQTPDAIAIRVIPNPAGYSALRWYFDQGFTGSPQALTVDGYEAIRDGRTVYVDAANVVAGTLFTNIYLISYNQDAEPATIAIYNKLIDNWNFNSNLTTPGHCVGLPSSYCSGTVGCWNFNNDFADDSGNNFHGKESGGVSFVPGVDGQAANFNIATDWVEVNHNAKLNFGSTGSFTVGAWIKSRSINSMGRIFCKETGVPAGAGWGYSCYSEATNNRLRCSLRDGDIGNQAFTFNDIQPFDNKWHHIVYVVDRSVNQAYAYMDGIKSSFAWDLSIGPLGPIDNIDNNGHLNFGRASQGAGYFDGFIDEIRIYDRALTDSEIAQLLVRTCLTDADCANMGYCTSDKAKVTRDTIRLARIYDIDQGIINYHSQHGDYPQLEAGSYVRNISLSVWPSWQATLGQALGMQLPIDPINQLDTTNCLAACPNCDPVTCWDALNEQFAWQAQLQAIPPTMPAGNYVFLYKYGSYTICAFSETGMLPAGVDCNSDCVPNCYGKDCGDDGCLPYLATECGTCGVGNCVNGQCLINCPTSGTGPGCLPSLHNGHIVPGFCANTGESCYDCNQGWNWVPPNCVCAPTCIGADQTCKDAQPDNSNLQASETCCGAGSCYECKTGYAWDAVSEKCVSTCVVDPCPNGSQPGCHNVAPLNAVPKIPYDSADCCTAGETCFACPTTHTWDGTTCVKNCVDTCSAIPNQPNCRTGGPPLNAVANPNPNTNTCCGVNETCYQCPTGTSWNPGLNQCVTSCTISCDTAGSQFCYNIASPPANSNTIGAATCCDPALACYECLPSFTWNGVDTCAQSCGNSVPDAGEDCDPDPGIPADNQDIFGAACCDAPNCTWICDGTPFKQDPFKFITGDAVSLKDGDSTKINFPACHSHGNALVDLDLTNNIFAGQVTIVFVTDTSGSMLDIIPGHPKNKIEETKDALKESINKLYLASLDGANIHVGLLRFSGPESPQGILTSFDIDDINILAHKNDLDLEVTNYSAFSNARTYTHDAVVMAHSMLKDYGGAKMIMILFSDGNPQCQLPCTPDQQNPSFTGSATAAKADSIEIYTIAYTTDPPLIQNMCDWSSDPVLNCGAQYAYASQDASSVYGAIVNEILNITGNPIDMTVNGFITTITATAINMIDRVVNLGNVSCSSDFQEVDFSSNFIPQVPAQSSIKFSNLRINYCPSCPAPNDCSDDTLFPNCSAVSSDPLGNPYWCDDDVTDFIGNLYSNCAQCPCTAGTCDLVSKICCDDVCDTVCADMNCLGIDPDCDPAGCCGDGTCNPAIETSVAGPGQCVADCACPDGICDFAEDGATCIDCWLGGAAGYGYRRPIIIQNTTGSTLTNYTVLVDIIGLDGLRSWSKLENDCRDIRFTASNGATLLNYWFEDFQCTRNNSEIWVKIPTLPIGNTTIYVYYGDPTASDNRNGEDTFYFFDDFEDGTWNDKWTNPNGGLQITNNSHGGNNALRTTSAFNNQALTIGAVLPTNYYIAGWFYCEPGFPDQDDFVVNAYFDANNFIEYRYNPEWTDNESYHIEENISGGSNVLSSNSPDIQTGVWTHFRITKDGLQTRFQVNDEFGFFDNNLNSNMSQEINAQQLLIDTWQQSRIDDIFTRQYANPEPSASFSGGEENRP